MKRFNYFFASACMALFCIIAMSCVKEILTTSDDQEATPGLLDIQTTLQASTRSGIKSAFAAGDKIGLILTHENTEKILNTDLVTGINLYSTYSAENIWEQQVYLGDEKANVYAYHPHNLTIHNSQKPIIYFFQPDQRDILYGTHAPNTPTYVDRFNPTATVCMKHATAVVEFLLKKENYNGAGKIQQVEIANSLYSSNNVLAADIYFNVVTGKIDDATESSIPITIKKENDVLGTLTTNFPDKGIEAFVLLLDSIRKTGDLQVIFTIDNREYIWNVPEATDWQAGYKYIYNITINGTDLILESVIIEDYIAGGTDDINLQ